MSELRTITLHGLNDGSPVSVELQVDKGCKLFLNTAEGDVSISEIPNNEQFILEMVNTNGEIEGYEVDGVIIRPNRPPRR